MLEIVWRHLPGGSWQRSMTFPRPAPSLTGRAFTGARVKTGYARRNGAGHRPIPATRLLSVSLCSSGGRTSGCVRRWRIREICGLEVTGTTLKVQAVDDLKAQHRLPLLLHLAKLPRSTFYDHRNRRGAYGASTRSGHLVAAGMDGVEEDRAEAHARSSCKAQGVAGADLTFTVARSVRLLGTC
jgi:hypothetical protein